MSIYYLLAKIGVDTTDDELSKVSSVIPNPVLKFHICIPPEVPAGLYKLLSREEAVVAAQVFDYLGGLTDFENLQMEEVAESGRRPSGAAS